MSAVLKAYFDWVVISPENCDCDRHWRVMPEAERAEIKPDDMVCERERAWRKYVRVRDGK
jgi:hypothetical protein